MWALIAVAVAGNPNGASSLRTRRYRSFRSWIHERAAWRSLPVVRRGWRLT